MAAQTGSAFPSSTGWNWGYDSLGQVTTAAHATNPANHRAYQYDAIGNRQRAVKGVLDPNDPSATSYTTNPLNQYSQITNNSITNNPISDADGNLTSGQIPAGSAGLVWDAENRLTTVSINGGDTVHYVYDSQSRRIARTVGTDTTLYVYDSWNVIAEYSTINNSPLTIHKTYLWGTDLSGTLQGAGGVGGLLSVIHHPQSSIYYPCFDGNGNISEYLDETGAIAAHFEYDPFGNTVVNTDAANQFSYRFSTKPQDSLPSLYYYGYRWYDSLTGRWPSRDPIEEDGGINLYAFVGNDGVNSWDVLGNQDFGECVHDCLWTFNRAIADATADHLVQNLACAASMFWNKKAAAVCFAHSVAKYKMACSVADRELTICIGKCSTTCPPPGS